MARLPNTLWTPLLLELLLKMTVAVIVVKTIIFVLNSFLLPQITLKAQLDTYGRQILKRPFDHRSPLMGQLLRPQHPSMSILLVLIQTQRVAFTHPMLLQPSQHSKNCLLWLVATRNLQSGKTALRLIVLLSLTVRTVKDTLLFLLNLGLHSQQIYFGWETSWT